MRVNQPLLRTFLLLAALSLPASGVVHANHAAKTEKTEAKENKASEGESKPEEGKEGAEPAPPQYQLGPALNGHFDRYTLRSAKNCVNYRYPIKDLVKTFNLAQTWVVRMNCAVEFGSESGMAEIASKRAACQTAILNAIERFTPQELMTAGGKLHLKEAIAAGINQRLTTVRVRQIYFTDFIVLQGD